MKRFWKIWLVIGALVVLSACSSEVGSSPEQASDLESAEASAADTAVPEEIPEETVEAEEPVDAEPIAVAAFEADAEQFVPWFEAFEPGTYRTDTLGTPMSYTSVEPLTTQPNGFGFFVVSDLLSRAPDDRDLVFLRTASFSDPTQPNAPQEEQTPWPANDFLGWLDNLPEGVIASEPEQTSVGGLPALRLDIELGEIDCGYQTGTCVGFARNGPADFKGLNLGSLYQVWVVDQDGQPIVIVAGIQNEADVEWFDRAQMFLDSVAFGEVSPNPSQFIGPGQVSVGALGGIEGDFVDNRQVFSMWAGRGLTSVGFYPPEESVIEFVDAPLDTDGRRYETSDEFLADVEEQGIEVAELAETTIGDVPARVVDISSARPPFIAHASEVEVGTPVSWEVGDGRLWLIEHPERGFQAIGAQASNDVDLQTAIDWFEAMIPSIRYVEG